MKKILILFVVILIPVLSNAHTWIDPYFEEAVEEAGLICIAVVQSSSPEKTNIQISKVFKGMHKLGDIVTIHRTPEVGHSHEEEALEKGDKYLFLVKTYGEDYVRFTDSFWHFPINDDSVIVPIRDPLAYVEINRNHFESFLGMIIEGKSTEEARPFVEDRLRELVATDPATKEYRDLELQIFTLEILHYFGEKTHLEKAAIFLESPYYQVKWSAVRAIVKCGGKSSKQLILKQLENEESPLIQSVLGHAIYKLNIEEAAPVLKSMIPDASAESVHLANSLMNPVFNTLPAPRYSYAAALMKLEGKKGTYDELLEKSKDYVETHPDIELDILENKKRYYDMESALAVPDSVFILSLSGKELTDLPPDVQKLQNLKALRIYDTQIQTLPDFLPDLELLELEYTDCELKSLPEVIYSCTSLRKLDFGSNELVKLDPGLFQLTDLEELLLTGNRVSQLPKEIGQLKKLKTLDLRMNDLASLPGSFDDLDMLKEIELYGNDFILYPEILAKCASLKEVVLGSNKIKRLPEIAVESKTLKYIDLSYNPLSFGARQEISKLPAAVIVNTEVYQDRIYSIREAIANPEIAQVIYDSNNDYSGGLDFSVLQQTERMFINRNQFNTFPEGITEMKELKMIHIRHNGIEVIPDSISKLTNLYHLDLSNNKLTNLPESIKKLPLTNLILSGNNFSEADRKLVESWFSKDCKITW